MSCKLVECFVAMEVLLNESPHDSRSLSSGGAETNEDDSATVHSQYVYPSTPYTQALTSNIHLFCFPSASSHCQEAFPDQYVGDKQDDGCSEGRYHEFVLTADSGVRRYASCLVTRAVHIGLGKSNDQKGGHGQNVHFDHELDPAAYNYYLLKPHLPKDRGSKSGPGSESEMSHRGRVSCFCLISPKPCYDILRACLTEFYMLSKLSKQKAQLGLLEDFIFSLVHEIIYPPPSFVQCTIPLTRINCRLSIRNPPTTASPPHLDFSMIPLFKALSIPNIVYAWSCLLLERPVVLHSSSPSLVVRCAEGLLALLAPFEWETVYIPLVPERLGDVIEAPTVFLIGGISSWVSSRPIPEGVISVALDEDVISRPDLSIPSIPMKRQLMDGLRAVIHPELKEMDFGANLGSLNGILSNSNGNVIDSSDPESNVRRLQDDIRAMFFRWFADLLHSYRAFYDSEGQFRTEAWVSSFPEEHRHFAEELSKTMMLQMWIQKRSTIGSFHQHATANLQLCTLYPDYFDRLIELHMGLPSQYVYGSHNKRRSSAFEHLGKFNIGSTRNRGIFTDPGISSSFTVSSARMNTFPTVNYTLDLPHQIDTRVINSPRIQSGSRKLQGHRRPGEFNPLELAALTSSPPVINSHHPRKGAILAVDEALSNHEYVTRDRDALLDMRRLAEKNHWTADDKSPSLQSMVCIQAKDRRTSVLFSPKMQRMESLGGLPKHHTGLKIADGVPTTLVTLAVTDLPGAITALCGTITSTECAKTSLVHAAEKLGHRCRRAPKAGTYHSTITELTQTWNSVPTLLSRSPSVGATAKNLPQKASSLPSLIYPISYAASWLKGTSSPSLDDNVGLRAASDETMVDEELYVTGVDKLPSPHAEALFAQEKLISKLKKAVSATSPNLNARFSPVAAEVPINAKQVTTSSRSLTQQSLRKDQIEAITIHPPSELNSGEYFKLEVSAATPETIVFPTPPQDSSVVTSPGDDIMEAAKQKTSFPLRRKLSKDATYLSHNGKRLSLASVAGLEEWKAQRRGSKQISHMSLEDPASFHTSKSTTRVYD